ncbi:MAG: histidine phosphatase family protein, partial [Pseudomonadota bacterium]
MTTDPVTADPTAAPFVIYCVRHGQTDWNAEQRYQGQADVPMNELGRNQAKRNGQAISKLNLDFASTQFFASPLDR